MKNYKLPENFGNKVEKKVTKTPPLEENFSANNSPSGLPTFQKIKAAMKPQKVKKEIKF